MITQSRILWLPESEDRSTAWDESSTLSSRNPSGVRIDSETALQSTVVLACARLLAESIASLPLHIYEYLDGGGKSPAKKHPLYRLLHVAPNSWQTAFEWREQQVLWLALWGNSYNLLVSGANGFATELHPLHPSRMKPERIENGRIRYKYRDESGREAVYSQDQIMHIRWLSDDGINGMIPVELARDAIGLARACEIHGARFFGNGARPGFVLTTENDMKAEAAAMLRDNWERMHRGADRSNRTAVLFGGLKPMELGGANNQEAQFLETRRFQIEEVCRLYRCPPHLVGDLTRSSFSNIEQQSIDFVQHTLLPWLRRFENAFARDLIVEDEKYFAEFDTRGLLRGDAAARASYYSTLTNLGVASVNEIRAWENLNPVDGGDLRFVGLNMQSLEQANAAAKMPQPGAEPQPEAAPPEEESQPTADVGGILAIVQQVSAGAVTPEAASAIFASVFPQMPKSIADSIITGAVVKKEEPPPPPPAPPGGEPPPDEPQPNSPPAPPAEEARAFCPTGKEGGVDNSCSSKEGSGSSSDDGSKGSKSVPKIDFQTTDDGEEFIAARNKGAARPENFSDPDPETLASATKFLSPDKKSGCLVTKDGDLGNVFNNGGKKGAGQAAVVRAIEHGAKTLDCYDDFLPALYSTLGFTPVAKVKFNDEYAPPNWNYDANGRPDVIIMAYTGGPRDTIRSRVGTFPPYRKLPDDKYTTDFDEAKRSARLQSESSERGAEEVSGRSHQVERDRHGLRALAVAEGERSASGQPIDDRGFCPTGEGGGIDNSCASKEGTGKSDSDKGGDSSQSGESAKPTSCKAPCHAPDVTKDTDNDGVTDAARVGVPAKEVPPPPGLRQLPNLSEREREAESEFMSEFNNDPDGVASKFREIVVAGGKPPTFGTDDAKVLCDEWSESNADSRAENRATLNTALHQTANAIAKRAFVQHLDTLKEGDEILVTVGGCGAGKGYAIKNDPEVLAMKDKSAAVWDSAGDQNATENPWILEEATARGLRVNYVYVHADPKTQWADPNRGVVKRASDPKDGRMVDAQVFADSYAIGAQNHNAFYEANRNNPSATFSFIDNTGPKPTRISGVPQSALDIDRKELAQFAVNTVREADVPQRVKDGALSGQRIWGPIDGDGDGIVNEEEKNKDKK